MKFSYNGKEVDLPSDVEKYLNSVKRRLNLPIEVRQRVMSDMITSICVRHEQGESFEKIIASLGTPRFAAGELNSQMSEYTYRKSPARYVFLIVSILGALWLISLIFAAIWPGFSFAVPNSIGIIGGADGPTSIYVTSSSSMFEILMSIIVICAGIFGFYRLSRCKKGKKN